jgi:hypothetical protein
MGMDGQHHALAVSTPEKRPIAHCIGGWVGLRAGLDGCWRSHTHWDSIPGPSSPYRVTILTELPQPPLGLCTQSINKNKNWKQTWFKHSQWHTDGVGVVWGFKPPPNSEVLTKLTQIPSSVEYTSVTTQSKYGFHSFANWVKLLTRGLPPPDPCSLRPWASTEFVGPPPPLKKNCWVRHWTQLQYTAPIWLYNHHYR